MYEQSAKQVLFHAKSAALDSGFETIEDAHCLLGVIRTAAELPVPRPASAHRPFELLVETVSNVKSRLETRSAPAVRHPFGPIGLGESAKRIMELASQEAWRLGHLRAHWGHMLLALSLAGSAPVRDALADAGLTPDVIRESLSAEFV